MVYVPPAAKALPPWRFNQMIGQIGQRVSWMRGHTCPCTYGPSGPYGKLATPGSAAAGCTQCFGVGVYWDEPTIPFTASISFRHGQGNTPDEPGVVMDSKFGQQMHGEPTITIPAYNPYLPQTSPAQPILTWQQAALNDIFIPVDMLARFNAVLQNGVIANLPYQQNLQIAPSGAVTTWNPNTLSLVPVTGYVVSGASVTLPSGVYPPDQNYIVEFQAAPLYVAFRSAGGAAHSRPFGQGTLQEPKVFKLQELDFWTRQRGNQPQAPGSTTTSGNFTPFASMIGQPLVGAPVP